MKLDQLSKVLQLYNAAISASQPEAAPRLTALSAAFTNYGEQTLKKMSPRLLTRAQMILQSRKFDDDNIAQVLENLAKILEAAGAKSSSEIRELARIISENFASSTEALIQALEATQAPSPHAGQPIRLDIVRLYADELARAETDTTAFNHVIARIKSDKKVRKQEVHEIAGQFLGYRVKSAPKAILLDKIADIQAKDVRQEVRSRS